MDMEFLKELLGEELFAQVEARINEHNGNEANKDNQIRIGNLGTGEYVGKGKYDALQELVKGKETELASANELIAELKKATKGNEELQGKFTEYEQENARLQAELQQTKINAAIKVGLLADGALDVDYLTFKLQEKLREKGQTLELDENENIKGWDDLSAGLKVQFPTQYKTKSEGGMRVLGDNRLPEGEGNKGLSKSELLKMPYAERARIAEENPEAYQAAMKS